MFQWIPQSTLYKDGPRVHPDWDLIQDRNLTPFNGYQASTQVGSHLFNDVIFVKRNKNLLLCCHNQNSEDMICQGLIVWNYTPECPDIVWVRLWAGELTFFCLKFVRGLYVKVLGAVKRPETNIENWMTYYGRLIWFTHETIKGIMKYNILCRCVLWKFKAKLANLITCSYNFFFILKRWHRYFTSLLFMLTPTLSLASF